jgi:uncharacterized membrane protein SpoIIM required for sporulation
MNIERWVRGRRATWQQLEELLQLIDRKGMSSLDCEQLRQLGKLYRAASADLSRVRALNIGGELGVYLNHLVVKAHNQVYQRPVDRWRDLAVFLLDTFPRLLRANILYLAVSFAIFCLPLLVSYGFVLHDINFAHLEVMKGEPLVSEELWHIIEQHQMWTDAAQDGSPAISSLIAANNIRVAILAFTMGITFGFGTAYVLITNGMMIGTIFGVCRAYGLDNRLLSFVAPHGVLELMAIFISGAGGLMLARALLFPGQYKRMDALKMAARPAFTLFGGCIPLLLIAGTIEGFISPRTDVPPEAKYAISVATAICLVLYLFVPRGKREREEIAAS